MKRLLIVVPGCRTGGVLSSLIALLNSSFVERYSVRLFIMNTYGEKLSPILEKYSIGKNWGTSLVVANLTHCSGVRKLFLIIFKLFIKIPYFGKRLSHLVERITINIIEREYYDCVISFQESISLPFVAKFTNTNKIAWIHCDYSRIYANYIYEYSIFSKYSKIVTVSEYTKKSFCTLFPSLKQNVYSVYNIMDTQSIISKAKEPILDTSFTSDIFTIISVGRVSEVKQFHLIPFIAADLKSRGLAFHWYIIGNIVEKESYSKLLEAIETKSVQDVVIYLGHKSNPYPYFAAADLLVSTSGSEACPMIFNEAKILNLPVVTNNFGSAFEFICDGQDGKVCSMNEMPRVIETIIEGNLSLRPSISNSFKDDVIQQRLDSILIFN